jgi:hypothetical protein
LFDGNRFFKANKGPKNKKGKTRQCFISIKLASNELFNMKLEIDYKGK